jgi:hypothetical protein
VRVEGFSSERHVFFLREQSDAAIRHRAVYIYPRLIVTDLYSNMSWSELPTRAFPVSPIAGNILGARLETELSSVAVSQIDSGRVRTREFAPVL